MASAGPAAAARPTATTSHRLLPLEGPPAAGSYLSSADPWLWLLVRREKTLRSLRGRVGGDEGGVKPTSGGLASGERAAPVSAHAGRGSGSRPERPVLAQGGGWARAPPSRHACNPETTRAAVTRSPRTRGGGERSEAPAGPPADPEPRAPALTRAARRRGFAVLCVSLATLPWETAPGASGASEREGPWRGLAGGARVRREPQGRGPRGRG